MANENESGPFQPSSQTRESFRREITQLLDTVPPEQWDDPEVRGVLYDFTPWHRSSSVTLQTKDDDPDPGEIAAWKYYYSAKSDGSLLRDQFDAYHNSGDSRRLVYHKLLVEAAEVFLSLDFGNYCSPKHITPASNLRDWNPIDDGFCLNKTFLLQVYDLDETFKFNYCEYVLARRHK